MYYPEGLRHLRQYSRSLRYNRDRLYCLAIFYICRFIRGIVRWLQNSVPFSSETVPSHPIAHRIASHFHLFIIYHFSNQQ